MYVLKPIEWIPSPQGHGWEIGKVGKISMFSCGPNAFNAAGAEGAYRLSINLPITVKVTEFKDMEACKTKAFLILEYFVKHVLEEVTS